MAKERRWTNADGLVVGFGTRTVASSSGAQPSVGGQRQQVVLTIKGTDLADAVATDSDAIVHGVTIPADSLLESAKLYVTTAFAGATAVMDIGIYNASTGAAVDDDGIDAAVAVGTLTDNAVVACDGALIGSVLANNSKVGVSYDTAAFTAGEATLVVEYVKQAA